MSEEADVQETSPDPVIEEPQKDDVPVVEEDKPAVEEETEKKEEIEVMPEEPVEESNKEDKIEEVAVEDSAAKEENIEKEDIVEVQQEQVENVQKDNEQTLENQDSDQSKENQENYPQDENNTEENKPEETINNEESETVNSQNEPEADKEVTNAEEIVKSKNDTEDKPEVEEVNLIKEESEVDALPSSRITDEPPKDAEKPIAPKLSARASKDIPASSSSDIKAKATNKNKESEKALEKESKEKEKLEREAKILAKKENEAKLKAEQEFKALEAMEEQKKLNALKEVQKIEDLKALAYIHKPVGLGLDDFESVSETDTRSIGCQTDISSRHILLNVLGAACSISETDFVLQDDLHQIAPNVSDSELQEFLTLYRPSLQLVFAGYVLRGISRDNPQKLAPSLLLFRNPPLDMLFPGEPRLKSNPDGPLIFPDNSYSQERQWWSSALITAHDFLLFCDDFKLQPQFTTKDVLIESFRDVAAQTQSSSLSFRGFCEALIRVAIIRYSSASNVYSFLQSSVSARSKIAALFMFLGFNDIELLSSKIVTTFKDRTNVDSDDVAAATNYALSSVSKSLLSDNSEKLSNSNSINRFSGAAQFVNLSSDALDREIADILGEGMTPILPKSANSNQQNASNSGKHNVVLHNMKTVFQHTNAIDDITPSARSAINEIDEDMRDFERSMEKDYTPAKNPPVSQYISKETKSSKDSKFVAIPLQASTLAPIPKQVKPSSYAAVYGTESGSTDVSSFSANRDSPIKRGSEQFKSAGLQSLGQKNDKGGLVVNDKRGPIVSKKPGVNDLKQVNESASKTVATKVVSKLVTNSVKPSTMKVGKEEKAVISEIKKTIETKKPVGKTEVINPKNSSKQLNIESDKSKPDIPRFPNPVNKKMVPINQPKKEELSPIPPAAPRQDKAHSNRKVAVSNSIPNSPMEDARLSYPPSQQINGYPSQHVNAYPNQQYPPATMQAPYYPPDEYYYSEYNVPPQQFSPDPYGYPPPQSYYNGYPPVPNPQYPSYYPPQQFYGGNPAYPPENFAGEIKKR